MPDRIKSPLVAKIVVTLALAAAVCVLMGISKIGSAFASFSPHHHDTGSRDASFTVVFFTPAFWAVWIPTRATLYVGAAFLAIPTLISLVLLFSPLVGLMAVVPLACWYWYFFMCLSRYSSPTG